MLSSLQRKARRFAKLDSPSRSLVLSSVFWLPVFWGRVKVLGHFHLCCHDHQRNHSREGVSSSHLESLIHIGQLVNRVAHYMIPPNNCLARSACLQWLLQRQGVAADLRLGVRLEDGKLHAHAWVEHFGTPINDAYDVAEQYPPMEWALPTSTPTDR